MHERAMEMEIMDASRRLRRLGRRLSTVQLAEELRTLESLQSAARQRPEAWRVVCARVGSAASWWLLQLALAVASAGGWGAARGLIGALPGLPDQAVHRALLDGAAMARRGDTATAAWAAMSWAGLQEVA